MSHTEVEMMRPRSHSDGEWRVMMRPELDAAEFMSLSPKQRVAKCREMAAEAERLAASRTGDVRASYIGLATRWSDLADEMETFAKE